MQYHKYDTYYCGSAQWVECEWSPGQHVREQTQQRCVNNDGKNCRVSELHYEGMCSVKERIHKAGYADRRSNTAGMSRLPYRTLASLLDRLSSDPCILSKQKQHALPAFYR